MYRKEDAGSSSGLGGLNGGGGHEKTSAQIISEAKASIARPLNGRRLLEDIYKPGAANSHVGGVPATKLVVTERPFTPKPRERHLYPRRGPARPQSGSINLQLIEEESGILAGGSNSR